MENITTAINLEAITATESHVSEIADPVSYYTSKAMEIFDMFQIDGSYSETGVRRNVQTWYENKCSLMNLFRKHPYWDEEEKAIVFKRDEHRPVEYRAAAHEMANLYYYVKEKISISSKTSKLLDSVRRALARYKSETLTDDMIEYIKLNCDSCIPKHINSILKQGVRITKLVNKIYKEVETESGDIVDATTIEDEHISGDRNFGSYQKHFAIFADYLSELTIKKITVLSLNFNDFMTMSNGNSWSSCHFINSHGIFHEDAESSYRGMYKQGCMSYALDDCSFIFYTLPAAYNGHEYYKEQKLNRMCCQYKEGLLVTGKCYPDNNDETITTYRQLMQYVISQCEGFANTWSFSRNTSRIAEFVDTAENSAHYRDYEYDGQKPTISIHKPFIINDIDEHTCMIIGHEAYCVDCGCELNAEEHSWLQCNCHRTKKVVCANCGCLIDIDDAYTIDGKYYCDDCTFYCDYHSAREIGNSQTIYVNGCRLILCDEAIKNYRQCKICGAWHKTEVDDYVCDDCKQALKYDGKIVRKSMYEVGEYVLLKPSFVNSELGTNLSMDEKYPNRIVKIEKKEMIFEDTIIYRISNIDNHNWKWISSWFVGSVVNGNDDMIGKKLEEVTL